MGQFRLAKAMGLSSAVALLLALGAQPALAAEPEAVSLEEETPAATASAPESEENPLVDDTAPADDTSTSDLPAQSEPTLDTASPAELPGETYYFVGARYRGIILPKFMINMFADGGTTLYVNSFGAEFGIRKDDFEFLPAISYADYGMDATPFKAKGDPPEAWELVESNLKVLFITADFLWSKPLNSQLAINYGAGAGFGFVFGDITRWEAYGATDADGNGLQKCNGPGNPSPACEDSEDEGFYGEEEPSWTDGGSKPVLFPWLVVQTGLRYKPHRNFVGRLDLGFGTSGFFFGLGADYGL
jgi:hypothetical protein